MSKDVLARVVATTIAAIGFALLLVFERGNPDRAQASYPADISASRR